VDLSVGSTVIRLFAGVLLVRIYVSEKLSHTADVCEMDESLTTAFVQLNARSERVKRLLDSNLASVLQTIGNGLGGAVDSNRYAINPGVHNALSQCSAREADECMLPLGSPQ
jgi:hypothetical protein